MANALFDSWTERYDSWFTTPTGQRVKTYETALLLDLLDPQPGERILDVGCGTGLFTQDVLARGAMVTGIDLSLSMLQVAVDRSGRAPFLGLGADMRALPFVDGTFDKLFSMTAIEFVTDAGAAIAEFERVTRKGGCLVVATLNSLSPWAAQRTQKGREGHTLFAQARFRSPADMRQLEPAPCVCRTAIHFEKHDPIERLAALETHGQQQQLETGAFLAVQWRKES